MSEDIGLWAFRSIQISLISRKSDHRYGITLRKLPGFSAALVSDESKHFECVFCTFVPSVFVVFILKLYLHIHQLFEYVWGLGVGVEG